MTAKNSIQQHREEIISIANKHGVTSIKVFGSVARGEETDRTILIFLLKWNEVVVSWTWRV